MAKYLVTGGAGFIGSNIVEKLVQSGDTVRVLDNLSSGRIENLETFKNSIEFIQGDIRNNEDTSKAVDGVDYVIHQAALASVPASMADPVLANEINVNGTLNLLWHAKNADVKKFVFASSCAVYGDNTNLPLREEEALDPISPYAVNKISAEFYCHMFSRTMGLNTVSLRYFNVFGPRQNPGSEYSAVIPAFIKCYRENTACIIDGDGKQSRDFIFVEDVAAANIKACLSDNNVSGKVFNVATGISRSIIETAIMLKDIMQKDNEPKHVPKRSGDIKDSCGNNIRAREELDFTPSVGFEEGLRRTVEWIKIQQS
jgi:UDP-N-acetylglucosamine/UDP-N-acetyl-alpha-D-glucosaminouronate 4-epimerase